MSSFLPRQHTRHLIRSTAVPYLRGSFFRRRSSAFFFCLWCQIVEFDGEQDMAGDSIVKLANRVRYERQNSSIFFLDFQRACFKKASREAGAAFKMTGLPATIASFSKFLSKPHFLKLRANICKKVCTLDNSRLNRLRSKTPLLIPLRYLPIKIHPLSRSRRAKIPRSDELGRPVGPVIRRKREYVTLD